jgi:hypothetical protein
MSFTPEFIRNIKEWVVRQKEVLKRAKESIDKLKDADRLELLMASQTACHVIEETLKGFLNWFKSPNVTTVMPKEMLKEVQEKLWNLMIEFLELDIEHTSKFLEYITKEKVTTIPALLLTKPSEEEERRLSYYHS